MSWDYDSNDFDFEKDVDIDVDSELDFDTDVNFDKDVDINVDVKSDVDIDGNLATLNFSVEAIGTDTLAEADVAVLVIEDELSEVAGSMVAAAS